MYGSMLVTGGIIITVIVGVILLDKLYQSLDQVIKYINNSYQMLSQSQTNKNGSTCFFDNKNLSEET